MSTPSTSRYASQRIPIMLVIGLTLLSGVAHGFLDGRWSTSSDLIAAGQKLADLPETCGDWVLVEKSELAPSAAEMLRCYGSEVRLYNNDKLGATVNVAVLFGPRGPIAVHTPEVCYSSVGTDQLGAAKTESISTQTSKHQLWAVQFAQAPNPEPSLDVWYAWSVGGPWQASDHPRFLLTESLYKIQVAGPPGDETTRPVRDFMEAFLPQVEKVIE